MRIENTDDVTVTKTYVDPFDSKKFVITLKTSELAQPGVRTGSIGIVACKDDPSICKSPLAGASWSIPYKISVTSTAPNLTPLKKLSGMSAWTQPQGNGRRSAYFPVATPLDPSKFTIRWIKAAPELGDQSPMISAESKVFLSSKFNYDIYANAINEFDGMEVWRARAQTAPIYVNGKIITPETYNSQQGITMLKADSGAFIAGEPAPSPDEQQGGRWPTADEKYVYFGTRLRAVDTSTASRRWIAEPYNGNSGVGSMNAADGKYIYSLYQLYRNDDGVFYVSALVVRNAENGTKVAVIENTNPTNTSSGYSLSGYGSVAIESSDRAITLSDGRSILSAFSISQKKQLWSTSARYYSLPAVGSGYVYIIRSEESGMQWMNLDAISASTGNTEWSVQIPATSNQLSYLSDKGYQVAILGNLAFISGNLEIKPETYAVDLTTRKIVWRFPAAGRMIVSENGILYLARTNKTLMAINLQ